MKQYWSLWKSL